MALAISIHNFPEGLATFASALGNIDIAIPIVIAIAIHNIPEGIAVSVPIYQATGSHKKAFWYSLLSGMAEPVAHSSDSCFCYLFGLPRFTRFYWHSYRVLWCSFHSMSCCGSRKIRSSSLRHRRRHHRHGSHGSQLLFSSNTRIISRPRKITTIDDCKENFSLVTLCKNSKRDSLFQQVNKSYEKFSARVHLGNFTISCNR